LKFPKDFLFGFSESGFQFEMGYPGHEDPNTDWWIWVHSPDNIASGIVSGDLPENGPAYFALYKLDHDIAESLGANTLRLGIEWSRIFSKPTRDVRVSVERDENGVIAHIDISESSLKALLEMANKSAIEHYRRIFRDWVDRGKKLVLNLNHFTLPSWVHDPVAVRTRGVFNAPSGWLSEDTVVEFTKYVYVVGTVFGDLADMWSTMNEPNVVAVAGYLMVKSGFPPGVPSLDYALLALRNQIVAHARAYDVLKAISGKPVGVIINYMWFEPYNEESESDKQATQQASYMYNYVFADAVTTGSSPLVSSEALKRRLDWIGVNYYTRMVVSSGGSSAGGWRVVPGYGNLCTAGGVSKAGRPCSDFGWEFYPEGLEKTLTAVYERYHLPIVVTENGVADSADSLRPRFIIRHLEATLKAIEKGADVRGYLHWALIDNYEWAMGYSMKFGVAKVDFEIKKRYLRPSALVFREIARRSELPEELLFD
jgi:beta-galactosidase